MPFRLDAAAADFAREFEKLLHMKRETAEDVDHIVREIIADVILRGDDALIDYSRRFDRIELTPETLRISAEEVDAAVAACPREQVDALKLARDRIVAFQAILMDAGLITTIRKTRGEDIDAACGQLAGQVQDRITRRLATRIVSAPAS